MVFALPVVLAAAAVFNVRDFGARGDDKTKDTAAIQAALDRCAAAPDGGEVDVPAGTYLVGSLELKSRTTLRLEKAALLQGSPDLADYPLIKVRWEGEWVDGYRAVVYASHAQEIAIVGEGAIHGDPGLSGRKMPRRPVLVEPIDCTDVRFEGFSTLHHSMWGLHPTRCDLVLVRNLTLRSVGGNGDGIDVDSCRHVLIEGCDISTGDDCIALKSGRGMEAYKEGRPTEDVTIRNCTFRDAIFADIGIGSETSAGIRGVRIEHCRFNGARTYAIYIKSRPGRAAFIEDIHARDLDVNTAPGGFLRINLLNSGLQGPDPVPGLEGIPSSRDYSFENVRVNCGTLVDARNLPPEKPLDGLRLENIRGTWTKGIDVGPVEHLVEKAIRKS